jgi:hypothetical protein
MHIQRDKRLQEFGKDDTLHRVPPWQADVMVGQFLEYLINSSRFPADTRQGAVFDQADRRKQANIVILI